VIRLPTAALNALRNRLADRGARPSLMLPAFTTGEDLLEHTLLEEYGPLCDAMYLMMAADGQLTGAERDVIRGALRELDDRIRSRHVEALIASSADALQKEGRDARYAALADALCEDRPRAEAAALLAVAVAYADGNVAASEDQVMTDLMRVLEITPSRMGELMSSLERMDSVLERDAKADAADVVVHAALGLRTAEDFERLAAKTDRPDVAIALRLYAAYVHAHDDLLDKSTHPRSLSTASVAALRKLGEGLPEGRSARLDKLREALLDLVQAMERVDRASTLPAVVEGNSSSPLSMLETGLARLSELVHESLSSFGVQVDAPRAINLRAAIEDTLLDRPSARQMAGGLLSRALSPLGATVPSAILTTVEDVLARLPSLPLEGAAAAAVPPPAADEVRLPEWLPKNRVLGGFYVVAPLGHGGEASVFVAVRSDDRDDRDAERFALKVPNYDAVAARSVSESEYLSVFKREAGALLALPEHPNIAGFVTFDARARPKPLLVMELVEGVDCLVQIEKHGLSSPRVGEILDGVLAGLSAMHGAGVGHLDVKPSNVVLRKGGEPVLVDFGLAGRQIRVNCATPPYAAPEVWGGSDPAATPFTADVYAFGCLAYELFTSEVLFDADNPLMCLTMHIGHDGGPAPVQAMMADARLAGIGRLVSSCLRRSAADRPNVDAVREALSALRPSLGGLSWPLPHRAG
jgi:eukaryotic-like serine/threonine-protein kinase